MLFRKTAIVVVAFMALATFLPVADARPVCTYSTNFVGGAASTTSYSCSKTFDALLVTAGNAVMDADIQVCLKSSSGSNLGCRSGCGYVIFTGIGSSVSFVTVTVDSLGGQSLACPPTAGTVVVQFGDTRDGGGF